MPVSRGVVRLLFVLLVAAGIACMHSLGHLSSGGHGSATSAAVHHTTAANPLAHASDGSVGAHMVMLASLAVDTETSAVAGDGVGGMLDPSNVCLAVLVAVVLAALFAAALRAVVASSRPAEVSHAVLALAWRGPPRSTLFGLRVADLSLLRI